MRVTFFLDDGSELTVKSDILKLANVDGQPLVAVVYSVGAATIPLLAFNGQLATSEELAARTAAKTSVAPVPEVPTDAKPN